MTFSNLRISGSLKWTLLCALLGVALGDYLFFQKGWFAGGQGIFGLALLGLLLASRPAVRRSPMALIAIFAAAIFAVALLYDASFLAWVMFWTAAGMATLLPSVERFDDGWLWFQRLLLHGFRATLAPIIDLSRIGKLRRRTVQRRINIGSAVALFALPIGGSVLIVMLLMAANPLLDAFISNGVDIDLSVFSLSRIIVWLLLFTAVWSVVRPRALKPLLGTFDGSGNLAIPGVSIASLFLSLISFNLLFTMQNIMDIAYLGGFILLPDDMTLAGYAHRGAYPLIATAMLAGGFVLVVLRPGSHAAAVPALRALVSLWIAQNILLVIFSILRTSDYIASYALTPLRIAALLWMVLVGLGLGLILWRMWKGKSARWLINSNLGAAATLLTMACFVDFGEESARWNIRHAKEVGEAGVHLDLCYLNQLGGSSLLPLIALEQAPDLSPQFRIRVQSVRTQLLESLEWEIENGRWTWLGKQRLKTARQELSSFAPLPLKAGFRSCDGRLGAPQESVPAMAPLTEAVAEPVVQTADDMFTTPALPLDALPEISGDALTGERVP